MLEKNIIILLGRYTHILIKYFLKYLCEEVYNKCCFVGTKLKYKTNLYYQLIWKYKLRSSWVTFLGIILYFMVITCPAGYYSAFREIIIVILLTLLYYGYTSVYFLKFV